MIIRGPTDGNEYRTVNNCCYFFTQFTSGRNSANLAIWLVPGWAIFLLSCPLTLVWHRNRSWFVYYDTNLQLYPEGRSIVIIITRVKSHVVKFCYFGFAINRELRQHECAHNTHTVEAEVKFPRKFQISVGK